LVRLALSVAASRAERRMAHNALCASARSEAASPWQKQTEHQANVDSWTNAARRVVAKENNAFEMVSAPSEIPHRGGVGE